MGTQSDGELELQMDGNGNENFTLRNLLLRTLKRRVSSTSSENTDESSCNILPTESHSQNVDAYNRITIIDQDKVSNKPLFFVLM